MPEQGKGGRNMIDSRKGAAFALVVAAAAIGLGLVIAFTDRSSSEKADMVKHPVIADARKKPMMTMGPAAQGAALPVPLASVLTTRQWLNTEPLRPDDLRGKGVLVDFW